MSDHPLSDNAFEPNKPGTADRDRIEAAVEELRKRGGIFVDAVRATRMAMVLTDPTLPGDPIVFANQAFLDLSGYAMDEVLGQQPYFMNGPDTDPEDAVRFREILANDEDGVVETVQYAKDGRRLVATVLLSAFKGDDGKTLHHFLSWTDVTRRVDAENDVVDLRKAQAALRESSARQRLLIGTWAQTEWETDAEGVVVADSPSWRAYTGQTLEEWLGYGWLDAIHPDDQAYAERQWREAMAMRSLVDAEFRLRAHSGEWRWTNVRAAPVLDRAGRIEKWAGMNIDIDARKRAEAALREREEQQRLTLELVPALLWSASPDGTEITLNEGWLTYTGQSELDTQNYGWLRAIHPDDLSGARTAFKHAFATGEPLERQQRIRKAGDGWRWHLVRHVPVRDESGVITRWFGAAVDIHESKLAEQALKETELRLQTLVEGVPQLVWRAAENGHWTWASPQWTSYTGQAEPDSHDFGWLEPLHPEDRDRALAVWEGAMERGAFHVEYRIRHHAEDRYRWFQTRATPVRNHAGQIVEWLGASTDVDQLRELQERQLVLVAELQHRTRNLLSVVRSMADKTARASTDLSDFRARYRDRLDALARVQGLLSRLNDVDRVTFDDLIRTELSAVNGGEERVTLVGPPGVRLRSSAVQTLAMALHELATNAVKYGALGQPDARLEVTWSFEPASDRERPWLHIVWSERGVTMPDAGSRPSGTGQGRELIEQALPYQLRARTSYILGPDGVHCTISIPVSSTEVSENV